MELRAKYSGHILPGQDKMEYLVGIYEPEPVLIRIVVSTYEIKSKISSERELGEFIYEKVKLGWAKRWMDDVIVGLKEPWFLQVHNLLIDDNVREFGGRQMFDELHRNTPSYAVEV